MFEIFISLLLGVQSIDKITTSELPELYQIVQTESSRPLVNAKSALILDSKSGKFLFKKNINEKLPIASLTKIMTALIIIQENNLEETVVIPNEINEIGGSSMYLVGNEKISVKNLLYGLLVKSGNDAAYSLAIYNSGDIDSFVKKMNKYAENLGLNSSNFSNPMGFDSESNYSTAYDLAILSNYLYKNPEIQKIVATKKITVKSEDKKYSHQLDSTNALLDDTAYHVIGFKTGHTDQSGGCFISYANSAHPKLTVVIGSNQRFHDTKILLDWAEHAFNYIKND